jgi:hypothetical protein
VFKGLTQGCRHAKKSALCPARLINRFVLTVFDAGEILHPSELS